MHPVIAVTYERTKTICAVCLFGFGLMIICLKVCEVTQRTNIQGLTQKAALRTRSLQWLRCSTQNVSDTQAGLPKSAVALTPLDLHCHLRVSTPEFNSYSSAGFSNTSRPRILFVRRGQLCIMCRRSNKWQCAEMTAQCQHNTRFF